VWETRNSDIYCLICQPDLAFRTRAHSSILAAAAGFQAASSGRSGSDVQVQKTRYLAVLIVTATPTRSPCRHYEAAPSHPALHQSLDTIPSQSRIIRPAISRQRRPGSRAVARGRPAADNVPPTAPRRRPTYDWSGIRQRSLATARPLKTIR